MAAAYRWSPSAEPADELRRLARAQVDRAVGELDLDDRDVAVHQIRKRCKKLRALLRLVRPVAGELYAAENPTIRDLARTLSDVRDDTVANETFGRLVDHGHDLLEPDAVLAVREGLTPEAVDVADREAALEHAREQLVALLTRIEVDWTLASDVAGADAVVDGFVRSYARGRSELADTLDAPTTDALHDWRKRVKDHGHHCRLLRLVWPPVLTLRAEVLNDLGDLLGEDHDLAILRDRLHADPDRYGGEVAVAATSALIARRRTERQEAAVTLGRRIYADRPKALRRRLHRWWDVAVSEDA